MSEPLSERSQEPDLSEEIPIKYDLQQVGPDAEQLGDDLDATPRTYSDWVERVRQREYERTVREEDFRRRGIDPSAIPQEIQNYHFLLGELSLAQDVLIAREAELGIQGQSQGGAQA